MNFIEKLKKEKENRHKFIKLTLGEKALEEEIERENKEHKKWQEEHDHKLELCKKALSVHNNIVSNKKTDNIERYAFNDPIKDGQERWIYYHDWWHRMSVSVHEDGLILFSQGDLYAGMTIELGDPDIIEIGAVIRKPNYTPVAIIEAN